MATIKDEDFVADMGAHHGFMNEDRPSYHPARSHEAWNRTILFFQKSY